MARKKKELKYEKYFLKDVITDGLRKEWGGQAISAGRGHDDIIPANARALPAITVVRQPYMFHEPTHKHMFTEYFLFFGSNPMDMHEFDADVEFTFGAEKEKHVINRPTIVVAAPGVYHCPLNYARVGKPFYCLELFMTTGYSGVDLGEDLNEIRAPEPDYNRYFIQDVIKYNKWGGEGIGLSAVPEHIIPAGARVTLGLTAVRKPYMFHAPTHKHNFTEFFYFFGSNPMDMKEFDAEIEFYIGEEKEKHIIDRPTVVVLPPGLFHCPLNYARVGKPFYCLELFMTPKYTSTDLPPQGT
ncbi:MAG: hypothetical protein JW762_03335 [Dehalococcoidales bacterium]|nr:hypothetical protein [Dehalococcoidales bacterium]